MTTYYNHESIMKGETALDALYVITYSLVCEKHLELYQNDYFTCDIDKWGCDSFFFTTWNVIDSEEISSKIKEIYFEYFGAECTFQEFYEGYITNNWIENMFRYFKAWEDAEKTHKLVLDSSDGTCVRGWNYCTYDADKETVYKALDRDFLGEDKNVAEFQFELYIDNKVVQAVGFAARQEDVQQMYDELCAFDSFKITYCNSVARKLYDSVTEVYYE